MFLESKVKGKQIEWDHSQNSRRSIDGETVETVSDFILGGSMKLKDAYSLEEKL